MTVVFLLAVLFGSLLAAALVAAPLRRASPRSWLTVLALVPVLALGLYQMLGTPAALDPALRATPAAAVGDAPHVDPAEFAEAVVQLRAELERNPQQPEGWALLARSLSVQGDAAGARDAYARALELVPDEPALMVEVAQASAQAHPQNLFDDQALALLERAATLQPANQRARWFIGVAQRQRNMDAEAVATWEALLPDVDPSTAASLTNQIAEAREAAGLPPATQAAAGVVGTEGGTTTAPPAIAQSGGSANAAVAAPAGSGLRVRISLAPGVAERLGGRGTVFVMARAPDGPPMPVAAERHDVSALPLEIVLDDADSPMPTQVLSQLEEALVSARVSASGTVERSADDVESAPVRVSLPTEAIVELVIGAE
ncbi:tetratricopeptide repeat protein [Luteimonas terricola]|uniref:Cytochrome c biogenesis protein n=1 Tax=Luteimonas terricola TaxID=645597 RepID=A0ABQ2EB25_9GAMM|nr:cytochrome C biogenesis protein [Luteimonas terricola]GGK04558.1 cytochrome c biogenesis protein [Luteimonas terricola]